MNKGLYGIPKNRTYDTKYHILVESASYAVTASYISPTFISASAAASGFGSGGGNGSISTSGSSLYSTNPATSNFSTTQGIFFGSNAGAGATDSNHSIFLGASAGNTAINSFASNFIGYQAGNTATNAYQSNFFGYGSGLLSSANNSNFFGRDTGQNTYSASYSTLIGYYVGKRITGNGINSNNIIIGTNITLPEDARDSINLGGIIFATGSYSNIGTDPYAGSANGKVGINVVKPIYTLDVSGSGNFTNGLIVSGGITGSFSGSVFGYTPNSATSSFVNNNQTSSFVTNSQTSSFVKNTQTSSMSVATASLALGPIAVIGTNLYSTSPSSKVPDSTQSNNIFLGSSAGNGATSSLADSIFLGNSAGFATSATGNAFRSVMIGRNTGINAISASNSVIIGYNAGGGIAGGSQSVGENNIIIGSQITLEAGRCNSINIGGLLFGTGSYFSTTTRTSASVSNGRIGINISNPKYNLDVSGSGNFTNGLNVTGGITGSFSGSVVGYVSNTQTGSFALTNADNTFTGDTNVFQTQIYVSNINNASGFNSEGAIHTDGGLRVTKDAWISGSLYVNNINVIGTASLLNITSSQLNIGTNLITVNTINPVDRYGGLAVIDSGSSPLVSASFLYDSVQDEFIFVHKGTAAGAITSSHFVLGPETYDSLGNEIYLTANRIPKGKGNEHLNDSNITDTGTIVSINSNTQITGSLDVTAGITGSFSGSVFGYVRNEATTSFVTNSQTGSFATTGSNNFNGNQIITGSLSQGLAGNIATGEYSHAEGSITKATGDYSHAEGDATQAIGFYSHAEGRETKTLVSAQYSHAEGYQTIASANYQHVQGQWNATSSVEAAFIIGNGTDDGNRSNLIYAHDSTVEITGSLEVNGGITGSLNGTATTASYIDPTFISASAAASGFGGGGLTYQQVQRLIALGS